MAWMIYITKSFNKTKSLTHINNINWHKTKSRDAATPKNHQLSYVEYHSYLFLFTILTLTTYKWIHCALPGWGFTD